MRIRVKEIGSSEKRIDSKSNIDSVIVKEDFANPSEELINIYFKGQNSSGILNFSREEIDSLMKSLKPRLDLIKDSKIGMLSAPEKIKPVSEKKVKKKRV